MDLLSDRLAVPVDRGDADELACLHVAEAAFFDDIVACLVSRRHGDRLAVAGFDGDIVIGGGLERAANMLALSMGWPASKISEQGKHRQQNSRQTLYRHFSSPPWAAIFGSGGALRAYNTNRLNF